LIRILKRWRRISNAEVCERVVNESESSECERGGVNILIDYIIDYIIVRGEWKTELRAQVSTSNSISIITNSSMRPFPLSLSLLSSLFPLPPSSPPSSPSPLFLTFCKEGRVCYYLPAIDGKVPLDEAVFAPEKILDIHQVCYPLPLLFI
jgi:hypothetical protein